MSPELDNELCTKYPKLFKNRYQSCEKTAMCWGFECGDGWFVLIDTLCFTITEHIKWRRAVRARDLWYNRKLKKAIEKNDFSILLNPNLSNNEFYVQECKNDFYANKFRKPAVKVEWVVVDQVKEKFNGLRFYYHGGDETVDGMVQLAEQLSYSISEHK